VTVTDDEAANAQQASYFRAELKMARQALVDVIGKRRPLIDRRAATSHLRAAVRSAEAEVRYLDRLIERLDNRFAGQLHRHE